MKKKESKYFNISLEKEYNDTQTLIGKIRGDGWFSPSTIIVNCSPDYSSRLTQVLNHGLSDMNRHELYEQIDLAMPYPNCNQVWNNLTKNYEVFDTYLKNWINENVYPCNFLFVDSGTLRGKNFNKLKLSLRMRLENENFRFASLYVQDDSILIPDYYVETFNKQEQGGLLFHWENPLNPNWDY
jgi:hypothetical protein